MPNDLDDDSVRIWARLDEHGKAIAEASGHGTAHEQVCALRYEVIEARLGELKANIRWWGLSVLVLVAGALIRDPQAVLSWLVTLVAKH